MADSARVPFPGGAVFLSLPFDRILVFPFVERDGTRGICLRSVHDGNSASALPRFLFSLVGWLLTRLPHLGP